MGNAPSNAPELGEKCHHDLGDKTGGRTNDPHQSPKIFAGLSQSLHQKRFGEGVDLALEDEDSGKLILTPVVLQKSPERLLLKN